MSFEVGSNNTTSSDGSYIYTDAMKPTIRYIDQHQYWNDTITSQHNGSYYNAFVSANNIIIYLPENELINDGDSFIINIMCYYNISRLYFNTRGLIHRVSDQLKYLVPPAAPYDQSNPIDLFYIDIKPGTEVKLVFYKTGGYGFAVVINGIIAGRN